MSQKPHNYESIVAVLCKSSCTLLRDALPLAMLSLCLVQDGSLRELPGEDVLLLPGLLQISLGLCV